MSVFHAYDIRGKYPFEISEKFTEKLGLVFPNVVKGKKYVVGYDAREGSEALCNAFTRGLIKRGKEVFIVGQCTAPMLYFASFFYEFDGGIMITASHNPPAYNGFKPVHKHGIPVHGKELQELKEDMEGYEWKEEKVIGGKTSIDIAFDYENFLEKFLSAHDLHIVVDCMNGTSRQELAVLERVNNVLLIREEPGGFKKAPNPLQDPLTELKKTIKKKKADFGVALDGDGDRVVFLDEQGKTISSDYVLTLFAEHLTEKRDTLVFDLRMTQQLEKVAETKKLKAKRSRVGHPFIKKYMRKYDARVGGELSGHYYFRETHATDSGIMAIIHFANILHKTKKPISELLNAYKTTALSEEINFEVKDREKALKKIEEAFGNGDKEDGITITLENAWFNVRPSNTEPLIRFRGEAATKKELNTIIKKVKKVLT